MASKSHKPIALIGRPLYQMGQEPGHHYAHRTVDYHRDICKAERLLASFYLKMIKRGYIHHQIVTLIGEAVNGFEVNQFFDDLNTPKGRHRFMKHAGKSKHGGE